MLSRGRERLPGKREDGHREGDLDGRERQRRGREPRDVEAGDRETRMRNIRRGRGDKGERRKRSVKQTRRRETERRARFQSERVRGTAPSTGVDARGEDPPTQESRPLFGFKQGKGCKTRSLGAGGWGWGGKG